jgi:predicted DNA-binding protein
MFPTASFSLTVELIAWIDAEAKRRGVSKSEIVRELITDAKTRQAA